MMVLDSNSSSPLHKQLSDRLRQDIQNGVYASGQKMPTEFELSKMFGVSRITVRNALNTLAQEGLFTRIRGKGTFVSHKRVSRNILKDISFTEMCISNGMIPGARTIKSIIEDATESDIQELGLPSPAKVIVIERIRYANNVPVSIEISRMPERFAFFLNEDLNSVSFQTTLAKHNLTFHSVKKTIKLVYASYEVAHYLSISQGYPIISLYTLSHDNTGYPAHRSTQLIVGDRIEFHI